MKIPLLSLSVLAACLAICRVAGLVGFTYVHVVPNEPLHHPMKVERFDGTNMVMESGEIIALWPLYASARSKEELYTDISNLVSLSDFKIDVEPWSGDELQIYARRFAKHRDCFPPVTIPLIRETVPRYRRAAVAFGAYASTNSQRNRPADGTRPLSLARP